MIIQRIIKIRIPQRGINNIHPQTIGFFGGFIMVLNYGDRSVSQIDPQTAKVVKTFTVGRSPVGLAFDGVNIWVANGGNDSVSRVKTSFAKPAP